MRHSRPFRLLRVAGLLAALLLAGLHGGLGHIACAQGAAPVPPPPEAAPEPSPGCRCPAALPPSPRVALLGAALPSHAPRAAPLALTAQAADRWLAMDKAKHAGSSLLLVLGGQYVFEEKSALRRDPALALSVGTSAAIGLAKEIYDWQAGPTRYFSARDLAADALGLLLGAGVVLL